MKDAQMVKQTKTVMETKKTPEIAVFARRKASQLFDAKVASAAAMAPENSLIQDLFSNNEL